MTTYDIAPKPLHERYRIAPARADMRGPFNLVVQTNEQHSTEHNFTNTEFRQIAGVIVGHLAQTDPEKLINFMSEVADAIQTATFPEPTIETVTDDGETFEAARCPHCNAIIDEDGVTAVDWGTRWAESHDVTVEQGLAPDYSIDYGESIEAEGLYYMHSECNRPIDVSSWTEHN